MEVKNQSEAPVAVLIEELRNEDMHIRLKSMSQIDLISKVLGPERTREELIPYLQDFIDDEDEILISLAEGLGKLVEFVGGPKFLHTLLLPLESLASVEETVVRDKCVESLGKLLPMLPEETLLNYGFPMMKRLASGEWHTSKISSGKIDFKKFLDLVIICYKTGKND